MMDYSANQYDDSTAAGPPTPLGGISSIADNINESCARVEKFLARFNGVPSVEKAAQLAPVACGHAGQLSRAHDAALRLEKLTSSLSDIG